MRPIELTESDRQIYAREIHPCLPDTVFDAHCHLIANRFHPELERTLPIACDPVLGDVDLPYMQAWWRALFPDSAVSGMLMGFPTADVDIDAENNYVAASAQSAGYPFALLVKPEMTEAALETDILRFEPSVLKPYMVFVRGKDPAMASITDLIPEPQIALADKHRLAIMLHVSKPRGMADPDNLDDIARLVRDYPNARFILAHCGRCFITPNMEATLEKLPRADNLWLDTSAVCDIGVFLTLLKGYDRSRIVFGTDLVTAAAFRGSYVRLGMGWHLCTSAMVARPGGTADRSTYAAYENLCALCFAVRHLDLSARERFALFCGNACTLYGYLFPKAPALA